jgi:flagellar hook-associated protein 2
MINPLRFSGLASGIDTESIVKKLMDAERIPLNKLGQKKQILEWRRDQYREINALLLSFRDEVFKMKLQSSFLAKQVISTNESKLTATATANVGNATYTISEATLATAAYNSSSAAISLNSADKIDPTKSLWSMRNKFAADPKDFNWVVENKSDSIAVSADGTEFRLSKGAIDQGTPITIKVTDSDNVQTEYTVYTDKTAFDAANDDKGVYVDLETGKLTFKQAIQSGSKIDANYGYKTFSFSITTYGEGGTEIKEDFTVEGTESLNGVLSRINNSKLGVIAYYDVATDKISIMRKVTGDFTDGAEIKVSGGFLNTVLKLNEANEKGGTNAKVTINGLETEKYSNTFQINGVTFTLKDAIDSAAPVTISVSNDVNKNFETIKNFVDKYNELIEKINAKISEKRYRDYLPLTEEQKKELSDKEVELWEEKAKSGLLRGDAILSSALSEFRRTLYSEVGGLSVTNNTLTEIGITTGAYQEQGKLYIDESKLKKALQDSPDEVMKLFTQSSNLDSEKGLAVRLYDNVNKAINRLTEKAGRNLGFSTVDKSLIGEELKDLDERINAFENRLKQVEDRYWRQFTAMEQAIQRANMQSGWLMQQFGGGGQN